MMMSSYDRDELMRRRDVARARQRETGSIGRPPWMLRDPIEDDEHVRDLLSDAAQKAKAEVDARHRRHRLGHSHFVWSRMKEIMKEEHGIVWHTPEEMNPLVRID